VTAAKRAITCDDILQAGRGGTVIILEGSIVTAAARDLADKMGVSLDELSSPTGPVPVTPIPDQETVRMITASVVARLQKESAGDLDPEEIDVVVSRIALLVKEHGGDTEKIMESLRCARPNRFGSRVVISSVGRDQPGIMSTLTSVLAECGVNIIDISQTIVRGFFTMIMIVDVSNSTISFSDLKKVLQEKGGELGVKIMAQHEEIFDYMHRIL
jgi:ACT domain-containing protein